MTSLGLVPLGTMTCALSMPHAIPNGPFGSRMVVDARDATFEGDRIHATQLGSAGGDWVVVAPNGVATLDVRLTFQTDDDATFLMTYRGRADFSAGFGTLYTAPLFETGDDRYHWLNLVQAVAKGTISDSGTRVTYDVYEAR